MKIKLNKSFFLLSVTVTLFFAGCNKEEEKEYGIPKDSTTYSSVEVYKIGENSITLDEVMWYVYIMEMDMKEDALAYQQSKGESYYEAIVDAESNTTVGEKVISEIDEMITYYEIMNDLVLESEKYDLEAVKEVVEPQAEEYYNSVNKDIAEKMGLKQEVYEEILTKWRLADMYYDEVSKLYDVDPVELVEDYYSEEELEQFTNDEYDKMLEMFEESYRKQLFDYDFETIEAEYSIDVNYEMLDDIEIKLGTFTK